MAETSLLQAIQQTLRSEMRRDDSIILMGEDIGALGGLFGVTEGLLDEFGDHRILDLPVSEGGMIGAAAGMAMAGMRPVPEIQSADFAWSGFDQIVSEVARIRYRSGGQYDCPVVLRLPVGGGVAGGMVQSLSPEAYFTHTAGLVVATPSDPGDAAGLMRTALRGRDPVVFLEPKRLYRSSRAELPDDPDHAVPFGVARLCREGRDVTLITYGATVAVAQQAAEDAANGGIQTDVIDLRTLVPFDIATVLRSIVKTGRALVVTESPKHGGFGAELTATLAERGLGHLEAPVLRVAGFDTPFPYVHEDLYLPDAGRIAAAIEQVANY